MNQYGHMHRRLKRLVAAQDKEGWPSKEVEKATKALLFVIGMANLNVLSHPENMPYIRKHLKEAFLALNKARERDGGT